MFKDFDAIEVGETQTLTKTITEVDVRKFVEVTGDDNPLHVDRSYAETTSFKDIVVHGMLGASFISTVIGTKLPGAGALWVSQNLEFLLPVRLGDELSISAKVLKLKKQAKAEAQIAESLLEGLAPVSPQEQQELHTEQSHYAVALRAKKDGVTQAYYDAIVKEIDERAATLAVDFGMDRDIPDYLTAPLVELHERLKAAVICRTGDLVTDLITVTAKIVTNEAAAKAFSAAAAKRKEHDFLMEQAAKLRDLAGTISKLGEYHFSQAMLRFQEEVNAYLPSHLGSFFMDLNIMRVGLLSPDGSFRTALSGAEQVAVHMAMASAFPEGKSGAARVITAPDVAWDKGTLSDCMRALVNSPHQIVLTSTIMPEDVEGWDVVVLDG